MEWIHCVLQSVVMLAFTNLCRGQCPLDPTHKIMRCIGKMGDLGLGRISNPEEVRPWDYQRTKMACDQGSFTYALSCAEDVLSNCPEKTEQLKKYVNIDRMRDAVEEMCEDVEDMKPYVYCMQQQLDQVRICAKRQKYLFNLKVKSAGADEDKRIQSICSFTNNVYGCQANPVRLHCGKAPAQFLLNFMSAFRPPYCPPPDGVENSAPQFRTGSHLCHLLRILICVMFVRSLTIFGRRL